MDHFSRSARDLVRRAIQIAQAQGSPKVELDHLLLVAGQDAIDRVAMPYFRERIQQAKQRVVETPVPPSASRSDPEFSSRLLETFVAALGFSQGQGCEAIEEEHILYCLDASQVAFQQQLRGRPEDDHEGCDAVEPGGKPERLSQESAIIPFDKRQILEHCLSDVDLEDIVPYPLSRAAQYTIARAWMRSSRQTLLVEHLFVSVLHADAVVESQGGARAVMMKMGVYAALLEQPGMMVLEGSLDSGRRKPVLSDLARRALDLAHVSATPDPVSTEHILLGLAGMGAGPVWNILQSLEVTPERIRAAMRELNL